MHSHYCDGEGELEEYVIKAIEKGMFAIGFSGHTPVPFDTDWAMKKENLSKYLEEINILKKKYDTDIQIYSGLEIDFIPNVIGANNYRDLDLDIIVGSVHYAGKFENGENCIIEYKEEIFIKGLELIFHNNIQELVKSYYRNIISMVNNDLPDIIGHLDVVKKFNSGNKYFDEKDRWHQKIVEEVIENIANTNCIVEINTRGYYKGTTKIFYPSRWIVERCFDHNIPITISSDAHNADDIDNGFNAAAELLLDVGYKYVDVFNKGKWSKAELKVDGLVLQ